MKQPPKPIRTERRGIQSQCKGVMIGFLNERLNGKRLDDAVGFPLRMADADDEYPPTLKRNSL